ncbi:hypothetical protein GCM10015535_35520 [Streptomyces gelaticus]|uniref:Uncharacterized protein n=1 Tax=Streptomyces gelaticus TaxID=285446 RepID=A0ABQ2VZL8_9ACTN|nr:hypothetical protein GCM10015535_35520 [Streptomyces gelaticus]
MVAMTSPLRAYRPPGRSRSCPTARPETVGGQEVPDDGPHAPFKAGAGRSSLNEWDP